MPSDCFHYAHVPDGPHGTWTGGAFERIEANNRALWQGVAKAEVEANGEFTTPDWREVTSPDGVVCYVVCFREQQSAGESRSRGRGEPLTRS